MSYCILECDRQCDICDRDEWEKEGYSSEEDYKQDLYESETAVKRLEDARKKARAEGRELTWEEEMDCIIWV